MTATHEALDELRAFKQAQVVQTQAFVKNLNEINSNMNKDVAEVRAEASRLWTGLEKNQAKIKENLSYIQAYAGRLDKLEAHGAELEVARVNLEALKCPLSDFNKHRDRVAERMTQLENQVARTHNLCLKLDQYQAKYAPVRVQAMVGDTLRACLTGTQRRNHDLYDHDKISLLYR